MDSTTGKTSHLRLAGKRLASRLLAVAANRIELLMVEVQEERDRLLKGILLALGIAVFGLLTVVGISASIIFCFWNSSPFVALMVLTAIYALITLALCAKFNKALGEWESLPSTLEQLRKDRQCLEENLR